MKGWDRTGYFSVAAAFYVLLRALEMMDMFNAVLAPGAILVAVVVFAIVVKQAIRAIIAITRIVVSVCSRRTRIITSRSG